jgi:hypothetical protein
MGVIMGIKDIPKDKVETIARQIGYIVTELMRCYGYAEAGQLDTIIVRFPLEVKRKIERLEREVGARLDKCWEMYDTVLKWCREQGYAPTQFALSNFAIVVCVEPYEKIK